jgi:hypothetical protein
MKLRFLRRAAIAITATAALLVASTGTPATARAVMGWPEWYPTGTYVRCVIGLEVGDYYGHPYAITRDLGYGVGSGWCSGLDPYNTANQHRFRVALTFWVPGCGTNPLVCTVTYTSGWVQGVGSSGTDTYIWVGGSYVAEPEKACVQAQHWSNSVGWAWDNSYPTPCVYY